MSRTMCGREVEVAALIGCILLGASAVARAEETEAPRERLMGVLINRITGDEVELLWRGNPGGREACNIIHNGYAGTLENTLALLEMCAERTDGRMRVLVRPNARDEAVYVRALLRSPHADLILGWYIVDEPFGFSWTVDDVPLPGETKAEFWFRYREEHGGTPPWRAKVREDCRRAADMTREERESVNQGGGDDIAWVFERREVIRRAETSVRSDPSCRNKAIREGKHLPIFADYASMCPTYGLVNGEIKVGVDRRRRLGYWWYDRGRGAATWRQTGSVKWQGKPVWRQFGAFGEDVIIDNWFASPNDADGTPRPRSSNRIDGAFELIRQEAPKTPVYFFVGYGQPAGNTHRNIKLAEKEGAVAGYLVWSWGLSDSIDGSWTGTDPDRHWAAMIESLP